MLQLPRARLRATNRHEAAPIPGRRGIRQQQLGQLRARRHSSKSRTLSLPPPARPGRSPDDCDYTPRARIQAEDAAQRTDAEADIPKPSTIAGAAGLLALITLFWIFRIATGGAGLAASGDAHFYYYPSYAAVGAALRDGTLPLWNPYQLCGHPWLATLQSGVLYPFHVLYIWLPAHTGMALSSWLHLVLAGGSMAVLLRRLELSGWACLLAAIVFTTQGRLPLQTGAPNVLEAAAWLAPGAVAVTGIVRGRVGSSAFLLAICLAASLLAGYPQNTVYACYTWGALLLILLFAEGTPARNWALPLGAFGAAVALGTLLASPQLLATQELVDQATRTFGPLSYETMFPAGWPRESLYHAFLVLMANSEFEIESPFGVTALLLLPFSLLSARRRLVVGLFVLLLVVFGIALGPASPLFDLYLMLPGVGSFRRPTAKLLLVIGFLVAVLAAFGLDELQRRLREAMGAPIAAVAGVVALGIASLEPFLGDGPRPVLPYWGDGPEAIYQTGLGPAAPSPQSPSRILFFAPGAGVHLPAKLGIARRRRVFDDYEPLSLLRQQNYLQYLAFGRIATSERAPFFGRLVLPKTVDAAEEMATRSRLLDVAGVRFLIAGRDRGSDPVLEAFARKSGFERQDEPRRGTEERGDHIVFQNPDATPRAFVTYRALPAPPDEELLRLLARPAFDPRKASYVEGPEIGSGPPGYRAGHGVTLERDEPGRVEISAELEADGLLVLSDSFYPGWEATLDGEPAEIFATNHLFRSVAVPAGRHEIVFDYSPTWVPKAGAGVGISIAGLAGLLWWDRRRPSAKREPDA
jgi:hypothetical protein